MKVYLAAKYDRRFQLREIRDKLVAEGIEVTAQWIDNAEESKGMAEAAQMDLDDIDRADTVVFFGLPKGSENTGGGRWFEFGYAYAKGKPCMAILHESGHESVFSALPSVVQENFVSVRELVISIKAFGNVISHRN